MELYEIQKRIRESVVESGMSLKEIAAKMGVSARIISRYKNGNSVPALDTFAKLCAVLDVSGNYILGLSDY